MKQIHITLHDFGKGVSQLKRLERFLKIHKNLGNRQYIQTLTDLMAHWESSQNE